MFGENGQREYRDLHNDISALIIWMQTKAHSGISTQKLNHSFLSDSFLEIDNMVSAAGKEKNSPTFPLRTSKKLSRKLAKRQFCVVILANLFT